MRKTLFVLTLLLLFILSACSTLEQTGTDSDISTDALVLTPSEDENATDSTEVSRETPDTTKPVTMESNPSGTEESKSATSTPPADEKSKEDTPRHDNSSTTEADTTHPDLTTETVADTNPAETGSTNPVVPPEPNATSADAYAIADLVVCYINEYRTAQSTSAAVRLPGLTEYARYRSRQIISDFSHNTFDERAAATALCYGMYVDPSLYGISGEPYYTACSGEAIAKAGYVGTIEHVAKSLADLIRNSSAHWSYVGASDYQYIGVGITYESGMWYCDIALTRENYG